MAENDLDINKLAAEFASQHLERFYRTGKSLFKSAADSVRLHLDRSYRSYITCLLERHSKAKSFFIRHEATYLYDFYVPLGVSCGKRSIDSTNIKEIISLGQNMIVTGIAGTGKSMLVRHLILDSIRHHEKVPIFIELRDLNDNDNDLMNLVKQTLLLNQFDLDVDYLDKALKAGHFTFFLDGFDEVDMSLRKKVSKEIQSLAKTYDKNFVIVTSRPDQEFAGWSLFTIVSINSLTLDQACNLISRLPYDEALKGKFLNDLREELFEQHNSFLSNPLLLSILLLTYGQSVDIPSKLSVFYSQAYEALFQRHDAYKGAYQRDRRCNLDIQDFARVFAVFCLQTYDKRRFQFSIPEALEYLERAKGLVSVSYNQNDFLWDALQAVCLLVEDGLTLSFSHRSFQEYFVARFIADSKPDIQQKLIARYSQNRGDSIIKLLYEINPELVERTYLIPKIQEMERYLKVKNKVGITHFVRFIKSEYEYFAFDQPYFAVNNPERGFSSAIRMALICCGDMIDWKGPFGENVEATEYARRVSVEMGVPAELRASEYSTQNEFIRLLAFGTGFFSINTIELAIKLKKVLIEKHRKLQSSLNEILK